MDLPSSLAIISLAALIHASFQLSVSVLVLLSGHSLGSKHSQAKLLSLTSSFVFGATIMTLLLLSSSSLILQNLFGSKAPQIIWAADCGILFGVAASVWMFYYRREKGTSLWIPREMANYLTNRTKSTKISGEAFGLGLTSVISEILFVIAPITVASLVLIQLAPIWQLAGIGIYTVVSLIPLLSVWTLVGGGHQISEIQKWRETNKNFLQFSAGAGLIILGLFVYVTQVLGTSIGR